MATPSAWRSRPRRHASVSTARRSLAPSTSTTPHNCIDASDQVDCRLLAGGKVRCPHVPVDALCPRRRPTGRRRLRGLTSPNGGRRASCGRRPAGNSANGGGVRGGGGLRGEVAREGRGAVSRGAPALVGSAAWVTGSHACAPSTNVIGRLGSWRSGDNLLPGRIGRRSLLGRVR